MITTSLTFLFGFFAATLLALLVAPVVWRRAKRLARREFEATIPATVNEIRASFDHVRAEAALQSRRREMDALAMREKAALERADAGRVARENADLRARNRHLAETMAQMEIDLKELRSAVEAGEDAFGRMEGELHETRLDLEQRTEELDDLALRFRELTQIAEERKIEIVTLESRLERVADDLRAAERREGEKQNAIERLRGEINTLEGHLQREKGSARKLDERVIRLTARLADQEEQVAAQGKRASRLIMDHHGDGEETPTGPVRSPEPPAAEDVPESNSAGAAPERTIARTVREALELPDHPLADEDLDEEALRQRIGDIAARVVQLTAAAEGPDSPIDKILGTPETSSTPSSADPETKQVTLADRIRRLRDKEAASGQATG